MGKYDKKPNIDEWGAMYNIEKLNEVIRRVNSGDVQVWAKELETIVNGGSCLEIGCGTGITSLWLASRGCNVCAMDYTESSVELVKSASQNLGIENIKVIRHDATKELPFEENAFDFIFQAGLLEHFEDDEQIELLRMWKKYSKHMVSMIPNKASLAYHIGKKIQEDENRWDYGRETPKHSFIREFERAGINVDKEYSIGAEWALKFLPKTHYIRDFYKQLMTDGYNLEEYMQGYLLVTIGTKE